MLSVLCPQAIPKKDDNKANSCVYEGMFGESRPVREDLRPVLFHRVGEILEEVGQRFQKVADNGKPILNALPGRRKMYSMADAEFLSQAVNFNSSIPRLVGNVASTKNMSVSFGDAAKAEGVAKQGLEANSMAFWMLHAILSWIKDEGFKPSQPQLFEELIQSFSLSMVNSCQSLASLSTFLHAKRREAILSHFPSHVGKHHRDQLQASDFAGDLLFDDEVLKRVLSESREDSATSANVALTKRFKFPVFNKNSNNSNSKSSDSKSQNSSKDKNSPNWNKRKAQSQDKGPRSKVPKSPKGGSSSGNSASKQGRGFQK